ncbi:MAG TPA: outer membrane beta-barrel protein, partial [Sphingomonas sp.]|nr:outer membrane beta-barrel protein [Sphingomonas sp.]
MAPRGQPFAGSKYHRAISCGALFPAMLFAAGAHAQVEDSDPAIANLPRPGYEPRTIRVGSTILSPELALLARYDDNVFATPTDRRGSAIVDLRTQVALRRTTPGLDIRAAVYGAGRRYTRYARENATTFGGRVGAAKTLGERSSLNVRTSFDRLYERRSDPEAIVDPSRRPSLIDRSEFAADVRTGGSRFDLSANATVSKFDYRRSIEDDRDLSSYQASVRGGVRFRGGSSIYLQPFVNHRDARLKVDRGGVNRDSTTMGVLAGVAFDLADRLSGDLGVGAFRADPADPRLGSYDGLAYSGRISWRPRIRTAVLFQAFRGDVATIRSGALGRVDTRLSLALDQEAHHDLIVRSFVALRNVHYRGSIDRDQRYLTVGAGLRYLLNRHVSLLLDADWTRRGADQPNERLHRHQTTTTLLFL